MADEPRAEPTNASKASAKRSQATTLMRAAAGAIALLCGFALIASMLLQNPAPSFPPYVRGASYSPPGGRPEHYEATPERSAAILSGLPQLKLGISRQQARAIMADPDIDKPSYMPSFIHPEDGRYSGIFWHYILWSTDADATNTNDDVVSLYFTPDDRLKNISHSGSEVLTP